MIDGLQMAADLVERRKQFYRDHGIWYMRPWIFLISSGDVDAFVLKKNLKQLLTIIEGARNKKYFLQPLAVGENIDRNFLGVITTRSVIKMKDAKLSNVISGLSC